MKTPITRNVRRRPVPSAISRGDGVCCSCFHVLEIMRPHHCAGCDRQVCALCVVRKAGEREVYCIDCANESDQING